MVCLESGHLRVIPMSELLDPVGGRVKTRIIDITSDHYKVARDYMIRLEPADFQDSDALAGLAAAAGVSPRELARVFGPVVGLPVPA